MKNRLKEFENGKLTILLGFIKNIVHYLSTFHIIFKDILKTANL